MNDVIRFRTACQAILPAAICSALAVGLLLPRCAIANGPEIGYDGGSIVPLVSRDIQLVRETVDLYAPLDDEYAAGRATCRYQLANLSDRSRTLSMSFIGGYPQGWNYPLPFSQSGFWVACDGVRAVVRMEKTDAVRWAGFGVSVPDSLPVWKVTVPARDSAIVEIEYEIRWSGGSDGETNGRDLTYYARPATLWAGPIREATFTIHLGEIATALLRDRPINRDVGSVRIGVEPSDAEWTWDGLRWKRANWEPDQNFRFSVSWDTPGAMID